MAETKQKWFKSRRYGLGWRPISWQGWITLLVYLLLIVWWFIATNANAKGNGFKIATFIAGAAIITLALIAICYRKGEPPTWRQGQGDGRKTD